MRITDMITQDEFAWYLVNFCQLLVNFCEQCTLRLRNSCESCVYLACSKRSDRGERCEVKKAMKSRGGLSHLSSSLAFIFSRSFLLRTHYLNAWNRLAFIANSEQRTKYIFSFAQGRVKLFVPLTGYNLYQAVFCPLQRGYSKEQMLAHRSIVTFPVTFLKADIVLVRAMCKRFSDGLHQEVVQFQLSVEKKPCTRII